MLDDIRVFEHDAGIDERGSIWTTWKKDDWKDLEFNHDKFTISKSNVLRGLHGDNKSSLDTAKIIKKNLLDNDLILKPLNRMSKFL